MRTTFCPHPDCPTNTDAMQFRCKRIGSYWTLVVGRVPRYRCAICGRTFSDRTFSLDYYSKKQFPYKELLQRISSGECVSAIARNLGTRSNIVHNRIDRLARNCLAAHAALSETHALDEDVVADGFESFDRSQFFPNNIAILVGARSQHVYAFAHATLRRKGRMTESQRKRRDEYERSFMPPPNAIESSFSRIADVIDEHWDRTRLAKLSLVTDKHLAYPRAVASNAGLAASMKNKSFSHIRIDGSLGRSVHNPLFPVNYFDRELRKDIAAFRRESTCFTRNASNGLMRLSLYQLWHNYRKPYRVSNAATPREVHGVVAGIQARAIARRMRGLFTRRAFLFRTKLEPWAREVWLKTAKTPLKVGAEYLTKYCRR